MDQLGIIRYIETTFAGVNVVTGTEGIAAGDTFFFYDPDRTLEGKDQQPFATIVIKDYGEFDNASDLDRPGVFRLNIHVSKKTFAAQVGATGDHHDYTALDVLMPHPVYAPQFWICVLNPSESTFARLQPLLAEAYDRAAARLARRRRVADPQAG